MRFAGTIGGTGTLQVALPIPALLPGLTTRALHLQIVAASPTDGQILGGATQIVVVDSAY